MAHLFPEDFFLTHWPKISEGLEKLGTSSDAKSLRANLQLISRDANFHAVRNGKPDFEAVLDDLPEAKSFFSSTLPKLIGLVKEVPSRFRSKSIPLLVEGVSKEVFLNYQEVATVLAMAFLGLLPNGASMSPLYFPKDGCAFPPNTEKLRCFLSYFEDITASDVVPEGGLRIIRFVGVDPPMTLEELEANKCRLCKMIACELKTPISESLAPLHVDFANSSVGGGIFLNAPGATAQEEIIFATHPELCLATVLSAVLQDNEALLIQGARRFSRHAGFLDTFTFAGKVDPSESDFSKAVVQVVIDAKMYDGGGIGRPYRYDHQLLRRTGCHCRCGNFCRFLICFCLVFRRLAAKYFKAPGPVLFDRGFRLKMLNEISTKRCVASRPRAVRIWVVAVPLGIGDVVPLEVLPL